MIANSKRLRHVLRAVALCLRVRACSSGFDLRFLTRDSRVLLESTQTGCRLLMATPKQLSRELVKKEGWMQKKGGLLTKTRAFWYEHATFAALRILDECFLYCARIIPSNLP